jgi:hypothetical protein
MAPFKLKNAKLFQNKKHYPNLVSSYQGSLLIYVTIIEVNHILVF